MTDKLMCIPKDDKQNYPFCRLRLLKCLDTQLNELFNQNLIRASKRYHKTLGTKIYLLY